MKDLCIVVPTYNRPASALRLLEAVWKTSTQDTDLLFVVDAEDKTLPLYPYDYTVITKTRGMIPALNHGAMVAVGRGYRNIGFFGDDHVPRTVGWDKHYIDVLDSFGTGMVYGNDLLQGENIPTQIAMTANIVNRLGWMAPPSFKHLWVDNAWLAMGKGLDAIKYLPETIIEHMHPANGKAEFDDDYARVNDPEVVKQDSEAYAVWEQQDLPRILETLRGLM